MTVSVAGRSAGAALPEAAGAPLVVLAWGNPGRGDDALGPLLASRLAALPAGPQGHFELVEDFQLQVEHAMDLRGRRLALFIDAAAGLPGPYSFTRLAVRMQATHSTHALAPESVLAVAAEVLGEAPPSAFLLAVGGERFGLGEPLSGVAQANLEAAWRFLGALLERPEATAWQALATAGDQR
jgi:hydrogenase maturation protease